MILSREVGGSVSYHNNGNTLAVIVTALDECCSLFLLHGENEEERKKGQGRQTDKCFREKSRAGEKERQVKEKVEK